MYRTLRRLRIVIALVAMGIPAWALLAGYETVFFHMQVLTALISGSLLCLIFWLAATFIYGRIYCSTVCPLGTTMDCSGTIWRLAARRRKDFRWHAPVRGIRMAFLILALVLILVGGAMLPTLLDPYSAYAVMVDQLIGVPLHGMLGRRIAFSLSAMGLAVAYFLIIVICTRRRGRLLCNTVCPVGSLLGLISSHSVFHVEINPEKCINCGECERVCKAECINLTDFTVDDSRCLICFDCMEVCPNDAINYRTGRHRLRMPLMQPLDTPKMAEPTEIEKS